MKCPVQKNVLTLRVNLLFGVQQNVLNTDVSLFQGVSFMWGSPVNDRLIHVTSLILLGTLIDTGDSSQSELVRSRAAQGPCHAGQGEV